MDIKETTPPPQQRTFSLNITQNEMEEIKLAFDNMLAREPQWYTNSQQEKVRVMRDKIYQMLRDRKCS
jgi:hypothetical protein